GFRELLTEAFGLEITQRPNPQKLGMRLKQFEGRNCGGYCFRSRDTHRSVKSWTVQPVGAPGAEARSDASSSVPADGGTGGTGGTSSTNARAPAHARPSETEDADDPYVLAHAFARAGAGDSPGPSGPSSPSSDGEVEWTF